MVKNYYVKTTNEDELVELTYFHFTLFFFFFFSSLSKTLCISSPVLAVVRSHLGTQAVVVVTDVREYK